MLTQMLADQVTLDSNCTTARSAVREAEKFEKDRALTEARIRRTVWDGESIDPITDIQLALFGRRNQELADVLEDLRVTLHAHVGQFILNKNAGHDWSGLAPPFAGVIRSSTLVFQRGAKQYHGALVLDVAPIIKFDSGTYTSELQCARRIDGQKFSIGFVYGEYPNLMAPFQDLGDNKSLLIGDSAVWSAISNKNEGKLLSAKIASLLERPLGTVPFWKQETLEFKQQLDREIPTLEKIRSQTKAMKRHLPEQTRGTAFEQVADAVARLHRVCTQLETFKQFVADWNA